MKFFEMMSRLIMQVMLKWGYRGGKISIALYQGAHREDSWGRSSWEIPTFPSNENALKTYQRRDSEDTQTQIILGGGVFITLVVSSLHVFLFVVGYGLIKTLMVLYVFIPMGATRWHVEVNTGLGYEWWRYYFVENSMFRELVNEYRLT